METLLRQHLPFLLFCHYICETRISEPAFHASASPGHLPSIGPSRPCRTSFRISATSPSIDIERSRKTSARHLPDAFKLRNDPAFQVGPTTVTRPISDDRGHFRHSRRENFSWWTRTDCERRLALTAVRSEDLEGGSLCKDVIRRDINVY